MKDLQNLLLTHFAAYPRMRPQDAVKLLYQREFGAEHLIKNRENALALLKKEMAELGEARPGETLYEAIGNGLCRLNLRPCVQKGIPAEDICALFCDAAAATRGEKKRFLQVLRTLEQLAEEGETPFDAIDLDVFLLSYRDAGCPALHHSREYRALYAPAYRLARQKQVKDYLAGRRAPGGNPEGPEGRAE